MSPEEVLARAARFKSWAENEGLYAVLDDLTATYIDAWQNTRLADQDGRERLWQAVQIVGKVKTHINVVIAGGKVAERDIAEIRQIKEGVLKKFF